MTSTWLWAVLLAAAPLAGQSTAKTKSGLPDPPKKDVPYIIHADTLLETESGEAKEETRKDDQLATVAGAASPVKTPLAGPEFLFESESVSPNKLQLFKMESRNARREVILSRKKKPVAKPIILSVFRVHDKTFKIRVDESLETGEYCLSPDGSNAVFCFAVE
jgi:hypothetical protein